MKSSTFFYLAVGIVMLITACVIVKCRQPQAQQASKTQLIKASDTDFAVKPDASFIDHAGIQHEQVAAGQNTFTAQTIADNKTVSLGGADTVALAMGILQKQVEDWKQIAQQTQQSNVKAQVLIDSLKKKVYYYRNQHVYLAFHTPVDSTSSGLFDYKINESLNIVQYWKRKWLLGAKQSYFDISSTDINTTIEGLKTFTIQQTEPTFALRGQVRTSYDLNSGRLIPSAGLQLSLGAFDIGARYYYSERNNRLQPILSAQYNVFTIR